MDLFTNIENTTGIIRIGRIVTGANYAITIDRGLLTMPGYVSSPSELTMSNGRLTISQGFIDVSRFSMSSVTATIINGGTLGKALVANAAGSFSEAINATGSNGSIGLRAVGNSISTVEATIMPRNLLADGCTVKTHWILQG